MEQLGGVVESELSVVVIEDQSLADRKRLLSREQRSMQALALKGNKPAIPSLWALKAKQTLEKLVVI